MVLFFWFLGPFLFGAAIGATLTIAVSYIIDKVIDVSDIKKQARQQFSAKAFKATIIMKQKTAVHVGIFDNAENELGVITIESENGVADNIQVGQTFFI